MSIGKRRKKAHPVVPGSQFLSTSAGSPRPVGLAAFVRRREIYKPVLRCADMRSARFYLLGGKAGAGELAPSLNEKS